MTANMKAAENYLEINRANWDDRARAHAESGGYGVDGLIADRNAVSEVVAFDRPRLGSLEGLDVLHLQCHIGTDTLSLARLGARSVTGVDLSPASLEHARKIATACGHPSITYVEADVYSAPEALHGQQFDLLYTGIGALSWLPSISRWADVVARLLRPGGRLFLREGHPVLFAMGDHAAPLKPSIGQEGSPDTTPALEFSYFEQAEPTVWTDGGTYVETDHEFTANTSVEWNHGLGEIVTALIRAGFTIEELTEHTSVPWEALPGQMHIGNHGEWELKQRPERLPASYTLKAVKPRTS